MKLETIENLVYKENINLINSYLEETPSCYFSYNNTKIIVLDKSKISSTNETKEYLTEVLGHYYMDATYNFNSNINLVSKQEYRAHKWAYNVLIPYEDLKLAIKNR